MNLANKTVVTPWNVAQLARNSCNSSLVFYEDETRYYIGSICENWSQELPELAGCRTFVSPQFFSAQGLCVSVPCEGQFVTGRVMWYRFKS